MLVEILKRKLENGQFISIMDLFQVPFHMQKEFYVIVLCLCV